MLSHYLPTTVQLTKNAKGTEWLSPNWTHHSVMHQLQNQPRLVRYLPGTGKYLNVRSVIIIGVISGGIPFIHIVALNCHAQIMDRSQGTTSSRYGGGGGAVLVVSGRYLMVIMRFRLQLYYFRILFSISLPQSGAYNLIDNYSAKFAPSSRAGRTTHSVKVVECYFSPFTRSHYSSAGLRMSSVQFNRRPGRRVQERAWIQSPCIDNWRCAPTFRCWLQIKGKTMTRLLITMLPMMTMVNLLKTHVHTNWNQRLFFLRFALLRFASLSSVVNP